MLPNEYTYIDADTEEKAPINEYILPSFHLNKETQTKKLHAKKINNRFVILIVLSVILLISIGLNIGALVTAFKGKSSKIEEDLVKKYLLKL